MSENGEPFTPRESAQIKLELCARDLKDCAVELVEARSNPLTRHLYTGKVHADLEEAHTRLSVLVSELRVTMDHGAAA